MPQSKLDTDLICKRKHEEDHINEMILILHSGDLFTHDVEKPSV